MANQERDVAVGFAAGFLIERKKGRFHGAECIQRPDKQAFFLSIMLQCAQCFTRYADGTKSCPLDGGDLRAVAAAGDYGQGVTPHLLSHKTMGRSTAPPDEENDPLIGEVLGGKLRVQRRIGQGGMGTVYVAEHLLLHRSVAVKVLNAQLASAPDLVSRLHSEARLAASISSPHIVEVFDVGIARDGRPYVEMELLLGESLAQRLARCSALCETDTIHIGEQLAEALAAAHESGVLHRDIKPENIFLCAREGADFVKLLDFGIAKIVRTTDETRLTRTGAVLGTPLYMSPEQVRSDPLDPRADIYGLGVVLYECLTGSVPHCAASYLSVVAKILMEDAEPPSKRCPDRQISKDLETIVMHAMARERDHRYSSMAELLTDLRCFRQGLPLSIFPHTSHAEPPTKPLPREALWRWFLLLFAMLLLLGSLEWRSRKTLPQQETQTLLAPKTPTQLPTLSGSQTTIPLVPIPTAAKAKQIAAKKQDPSPTKKHAPLLPSQNAASDPLDDEQAPNPFRNPRAPQSPD